ncbi:MAG: hypothetical protein IPM56_05150 [Ignavibacteriales bacterium]|nr:MAG: hypothetical protein IPM56_05150 [Ignavibacteriales bacterium]
MKLKIIFSAIIIFSTVTTAQYNGGIGSGGISGTSTAVTLSAFLQGPYSGGTMTTTLNTNNFIPLSQPYSAAPWNYTGDETVASIPTGVVDWVLVELRRNTADSSTVQKRACFILNDGTIVDLDGSSPVNFYKAGDISSYYVVIRHRNHLAVMSANSLSLTSSLSGSYLIGGNSEYDFSTAQTQAFGTNPMLDLLGNGTAFGLWTGDANGDGVVKFNLANNDRLLIYNRIGNGGFNATASGYYPEDFNLDGVVKFNLSNNDRLLIYNVIGNAGFNVTRPTQVPN